MSQVRGIEYVDTRGGPIGGIGGPRPGAIAASDIWDYYKIARNGYVLRFVVDDGGVTDGTVKS